jgi:GH35 family endo-1,4-beta-xylanase
MTPAQINRLHLEHGFLLRVKLWLDEGGSGYLADNAAELAVKELWEHWLCVMDHYDDDGARTTFLDEVNEVIKALEKFRDKFV